MYVHTCPHRSSQFNVADVRKDIAAMEDEKEQLMKRIERLQKKASTMPKQAEMLETARQLRKERDRSEQDTIHTLSVLCTTRTWVYNYTHTCKTKEALYYMYGVYWFSFCFIFLTCVVFMYMHVCH